MKRTNPAKTRQLFTLLALSLFSLTAHAAPLPNLHNLDFNGNGLIDEVELAVGLEFQYDKSTATRLRDLLKKKVTDYDAAGVAKETRSMALPWFLKMNHLPAKGPWAMETIAKAGIDPTGADMRPARPVDAQAKYIPATTSSQFFIRRDKDDVSAAPEDRKGALFSFGKYYSQGGSEQFLARGTVGFATSYVPNHSDDYAGGDRWLNEYGYDGSVLFDRVTGVGGLGDPTDVLEFSLGGHWQFSATPIKHEQPTRGSIADDINQNRQTVVAERGGVLASVALVDSTDFHFDQHRFGGTLDIEPVLPSYGFHGFPDTFGGTVLPFHYTLRARLHVDGGFVQGADDNTQDQFLRIGPALELSITPKAFDKRVKLYSAWDYCPDVLGGETSSLLKAGLRYELPILLNPSPYSEEDYKGKVTISLEYRNGELPFSGKRDESLVIGLGILF
jgi:hypothetical protein